VKEVSMNPRAVQMAKAVASILSPTELAEYGNVLAPTYKGWNNNSMQYYTNQTNTYGVYPGAPTMFDYWVNGFSSTGQPRWAMPPARFNQQSVLPDNSSPAVNNPAAIQYSFTYPRSNNPVPPPIGNLS